MMHLPLKVPGHTGVPWMAIMIVGRSAVNRRGAATIMGVTSGVIIAATVPGREGLLAIVKYAAAGLVIDGFAWLFRERFDRPAYAAIAAAAAHTAKLVTSLLLGLAMGVPAGFLAVGLGLAMTTHVFFGGLGGLLGSWIVRFLRNAPVPSVRALFKTEASG